MPLSVPERATVPVSVYVYPGTLYCDYLGTPVPVSVPERGHLYRGGDGEDLCQRGPHGRRRARYRYKISWQKNT